MLQSKDKEWLNGHKISSITMLPTRLTSDVDTHRLKVRGWRKEFHSNENKNKAGAAILRQNRL